MNIHFEGKTAIVTGAAHGFGRAIALGFAERGASVWACDVLGDELQETRQRCLSAGGNCRVKLVDVRNRGEVFGFVAELLAVESAVDILVNNAGGVLGQVGRPLEEISEQDWDSIFEVNTRGALLLCAGGRAEHESAAIWAHHQYLKRRWLGHQPHRHPSLRLRQSGANRLNPPTGA